MQILCQPSQNLYAITLDKKGDLKPFEVGNMKWLVGLQKAIFEVP
jgi:hypothetical protein